MKSSDRGVAASVFPVLWFTTLFTTPMEAIVRAEDTVAEERNRILRTTHVEGLWVAPEVGPLLSDAFPHRWYRVCVTDEEET